jgi:hypothetical protein
MQAAERYRRFIQSKKQINHKIKIMKKKLLIMLIFVGVIIKPSISFAQNNGTAGAAIAGGIIGIGIGLAAIEDLKEQLELTGTEWLLENHPEISSFSLKTLDFEGKKLKDMSNVSVLTYKLQEFKPTEESKLDGRKQVLFAFTSYGWFNDYGLDYNKVSWYLIDEDEWVKMMIAYAKVSSMEKNEQTLRESIKNGVVVNKGIRVKNKIEVPFYKLEGDMYLVTDYSSKMKFIYNEKSLGIFLKETGNLVQIRRSTILEIHEFFFGSK